MRAGLVIDRSSQLWLLRPQAWGPVIFALSASPSCPWRLRESVPRLCPVAVSYKAPDSPLKMWTSVADLSFD